MTGCIHVAQGPVVEPLDTVTDSRVGLLDAKESVVAQRRHNPALGLQYAIFHLGLVAWFADAGWNDGGAIVLGEVGIGAIELRFVVTGLVDASFEIVGHRDRGN